MRTFLHFVCVLLCFVCCSEGQKEVSPLFEILMATVGRMVFITFDVCVLLGWSLSVVVQSQTF